MRLLPILGEYLCWKVKSANSNLIQIKYENSTSFLGGKIVPLI
jgi:hypothetical protein